MYDGLMPAPIPCEHSPRGCSACRQSRVKARKSAWHGERRKRPDHYKRRLEKESETARAHRLDHLRQYTSTAEYKARRRAQSQMHRLDPLKRAKLAASLAFQAGLPWADGQIPIAAEMLAQSSCCAVCEREFSEASYKDGLVRGILCNGCNCAIGHAKESLIVLKSAVAYMERCQSLPSYKSALLLKKPEVL